MANFITLSRIFMVFIVVGILFIKPEWSHISLILTIFVMWFDGLDGYIARKFNEVSRLGSLLDIMGDRIVENVFWITFSALSWINPIIPIVVLSRGIITDTLRSLAFEKGYTAFGKTTMIQNPIAKFIVASNTSRFTYAVVKAFAFLFIIGGHLSFSYPHQETILKTGEICAWISMAFCVLRGIPVIFESKRFIDEQ